MHEGAEGRIDAYGGVEEESATGRAGQEANLVHLHEETKLRKRKSDNNTSPGIRPTCDTASFMAYH